MNVQKLDAYVGAGLGYTIYSWSWKSGYEDLEGATGGSGLYLQTVVGGRYYISPKMAISLRLVGSLIGSWAGFGSTIGLSFNLK